MMKSDLMRFLSSTYLAFLIKKERDEKSNEREERKEMGVGIKIVSASRSLRRLEPKP